MAGTHLYEELFFFFFPLKQLPSIKKVCIYVHLKNTTLLNSISANGMSSWFVGWRLNNQVFSLDTPRTHFFLIQRPHFSPLLPSLLEWAFMQIQQGGGRNVTCLQWLAFPPEDTLSCSLLGGTFLQLCLFRLVEPSRGPLSFLMWEAIAVPGRPGTWRPSSIPPGRDLLGCHWAPLTRLFGGMMCSAFPGGTGGLPNSDLCGRVGESPPQVLSPVSVVIVPLRKRFPGPQKWPVFQHCLLMLTTVWEPLHKRIYSLCRTMFSKRQVSWSLLAVPGGPWNVQESVAVPVTSSSHVPRDRRDPGCWKPDMLISPRHIRHWGFCFVSFCFVFSY